MVFTKVVFKLVVLPVDLLKGRVLMALWTGQAAWLMTQKVFCSVWKCFSQSEWNSLARLNSLSLSKGIFFNVKLIRKVSILYVLSFFQQWNFSYFFPPYASIESMDWVGKGRENNFLSRECFTWALGGYWVFFPLEA